MFKRAADRSLGRAALPPIIAVTGLGLFFVLPSGLAGCAQPGGPHSAAASTAAPAAQVHAQQAPAPSASDADRLTHLVARAVPFWTAMQWLLDENPNPPWAAKPQPAQSQCVRQRLSPAGFRENRKQTVVELIKRYPDQVQGAIDVLEQGAANVAGTIFLGDRKKATTAGQPLTLEQARRSTDLVHNNQYWSSREWLLFGHTEWPIFGAQLSATDDDPRGYEIRVYQTIARKLLLDAMAYCHVPVSAILP